MSFAIGPRLASRSVPLLKRSENTKDVGTAPENRVAFTPFYWESAFVEACSDPFDLHFGLVGSAREFERLAPAS